MLLASAESLDHLARGKGNVDTDTRATSGHELTCSSSHCSSFVTSPVLSAIWKASSLALYIFYSDTLKFILFRVHLGEENVEENASQARQKKEYS